MGLAAAAAANGAQGQDMEGETHGKEGEGIPLSGTETEAKDRWIAESWRPRWRSREKGSKRSGRIWEEEEPKGWWWPRIGSALGLRRRVD
jgi:hypothetical protein